MLSTASALNPEFGCTSSRRVVSLTTYWLRRDKEEIVCQILYDSQLDRQQEECGDRYPIPVNNDA